MGDERGDVETRRADGNADRGVGGLERRGEKWNGWRRRLQESKLGDFEFQSIKLLAFRRAVVATATAAVVRSSSSPLSLSLLSLFFLSHPFLFFSLSPIRPPSFFPVSSLPPASNGSFAAEIHTDVSPTPSRTPHSSFSSFLPRCSPSPPSLSPFSSRPSAAAPPPPPTNLHVYTRACGRALSAVARVHTPSTARRDSTTFYCRQTERANGRKGERRPDVTAKTKIERKRG